jgi:hypothetical protein
MGTDKQTHAASPLTKLNIPTVPETTKWWHPRIWVYVKSRFESPSQVDLKIPPFPANPKLHQNLCTKTVIPSHDNLSCTQYAQPQFCTILVASSMFTATGKIVLLSYTKAIRERKGLPAKAMVTSPTTKLQPLLRCLQLHAQNGIGCSPPCKPNMSVTALHAVTLRAHGKISTKASEWKRKKPLF